MRWPGVAARDEFWAIEANRTGRLRPLVAASIGPYGAMLADGSEYRGHYSLDDMALADFHRPRLRALAGAGADLLACETIPCSREARVLAGLLREFPNVCAWLSFSCKDGERNCEGEDIGECAASLDGHPQIVATGVNCTPPQYVEPLLRRMRAATDKPLVAYPNSGESYDAASKQWSGNPNALEFGEQARRWYAAGARLIGGCCRTGPLEHSQREAMHAYRTLGVAAAFGVAAASGRGATVDELAADWELVHETVHLALPELGRKHDWLAEGSGDLCRGYRTRAIRQSRRRRRLGRRPAFSMPLACCVPVKAAWIRRRRGDALTGVARCSACDRMFSNT